MIKQTARSAPNREQDINALVHRADFNNDLYLQEFGISISNSMTKVHGRVLPPPKLQYGGPNLPIRVKKYDQIFFHCVHTFYI